MGGDDDGVSDVSQAGEVPNGLGDTTTIELDVAPGFVTYERVSGELYMTTDSGLLVIDPDNPEAQRTISVPTNFGSKVAVDHATNTAWVSLNDRYNCAECRELSVVDTQRNQVIDTLTLPYSVIAVAIDPALRRVFAINRPDNQEEVPDLGQGWITAFDADSREELATIEVPFPAYAMSVDADSHKAVVAGWMGATVISTDTLEIEDPGLDIRSSSSAAAVDSRTGTGYVVSSDTLFTIDLSTGQLESEHRFPADPGPGQLAVDPNGALVALDNGDLLIIDPRTRDVTASTPMQREVHWMELAVNPTSGQVYVADAEAQDLSVVGRR